MSAWPSFIDPRDLAPGDLSPHPDLPENIRLHEIETPDDPLFDLAYKLLVDIRSDLKLKDESQDLSSSSGGSHRRHFFPSMFNLTNADDCFHVPGELYNINITKDHSENVISQDLDSSELSSSNAKTTSRMTYAHTQ